MKLAGVANEFLSHRRIAVAGVSRTQPNAANVIYKRLRAAGYQVFACNPNADEVEGDRCYHSVADIDVQIDGMVIATHPDAALSVARECALHGVPRVWMHSAVGNGSYSTAAIQCCEEHGIAVIDGGCPMMFIEPVDFGHRCMRWVLGVTGKLPDGSRYSAADRSALRELST